MSENSIERCPECDVLTRGEPLDRRNFLRAVGAAALMSTTGVIPAVARADSPVTRKSASPAENLVKELHSTFNDNQRQTLVLPWDDGASKNGIPTRMGMYNAAAKGIKIGANYSKSQQELLNKIIRAVISEDDQAFKRISRNGTWDASKSFEECGALLFGDPADGKKFAWLFSGHHLTLRCDGNSEGAAFGGPIYYGHSPNGYSETNVFYYQTEKAVEVFKSLDAKQRDKAIVGGKQLELAPSIRFRKPELAKPGIACKDLTSEQKSLVEIVLKSVLTPYRKEDAAAVMQVLKANGGLDKMNLAFYYDEPINVEKERWTSWRLEAPGFVWNYRVLPHIHCYVNIAANMI